MPAKPPAQRKTSRAAKPRLRPDAGGKERRGLSIFLRQVREFRLALALYNDPGERDRLVRSLAEELAPDRLRVLTLDLRERAGERTLLARVEALVKSAALSPCERVAVMLVNLEGCIDYSPELAQPGGPGTAFVETANFHRELFPKVCPGPLVIWMTELLERAFVRHAPDLWHWRSHVFDLRTRRTAIEARASSERKPLPSDDFRLHPEDRLRRLEEELAAYRKAGARFEECRVLNAMGLARLDAGDARLAVKDFEAALEISRNIGNQRGEAAGLGNLGNACADLGDARTAIEFYEQQLAIAREIGERSGEGSAIGNLGNAYSRLGDTRKAIEFYLKALVIRREIGDRRAEGIVLGSLGNACADLGDARKAIEFYEQRLAIAREIGDRRGEGSALGNLGLAYADLGDTRKAIEFYEQQLVIVREIGDRRGEGNAGWNSALALDSLGERTKAIRCAEDALRIYEAIDDPNADMVRAKLAEWRGGTA